MCYYPTIIRNRKYVKNGKNGGVIPFVRDPRVLSVPIGCGNCQECRRKKSREWQVRLFEDIKTNQNGKFVTLTFSNESIRDIYEKYVPDEAEGYDIDNMIATRALHLFRERWRKEFKKSPRHWLVSELGHQNTENIHLHGIIWLETYRLYNKITKEWYDYQATMEDVERIWKYGFVWKYKMERGKKVNYVNNKTINYVTKYVTQQDFQHKYYKPIILTSPGIGRDYVKTHNARLNKYKKGKTDEAYTTETGHKISMPIYWRNKIYTENEREELWLEKLDKNERWVGGEKIKVDKNNDDYYKTLEHYRKLNNELGYRGREKKWEREEYEKERRNLLIQERLSRAA